MNIGTVREKEGVEKGERRERGGRDEREREEMRERGGRKKGERRER